MDNHDIDQAAELEFKKRLLELGLLTGITPPLAPDATRAEHQPIPVCGNPVSETVIKERR
jgi:hypothetical protein